VEDRVCLDIGASTGGFTDCLLQSGARRVYALDVGSGQLDWKLRNHPRVIVKEGLNARYLRPEDLGERVDLAVCDVSFISVTLILPVLPKLLTETGEMVILVKPQFEVGRGQVGKGGIVRDAGLHRAACARVEQAVQQLGFRTGLMESPVRGAEGNKEFFIHARH
jgi:23S rRNA (cytidine1920-2'-O)/16S rRNA (cytidine1409-2'-O)-methyltransferase